MTKTEEEQGKAINSKTSFAVENERKRIARAMSVRRDLLKSMPDGHKGKRSRIQELETLADIIGITLD